MATEQTPRFQWPIPRWNADWQEWQQFFRDLVNNIDADVFATMDNLKLIPKSLPSVNITGSGPSTFAQLADATFVSRTYNTDITISAASFALIPESILAVSLTPGAVGPQNPEWQQIELGMAIDPSLQALGYVTARSDIRWFNGATLLSGGPTQALFEFPGGSGGGGDLVKVSSSDTAANYLGSKLSAGSGVVLTVLNPGSAEQLEVSARNAPMSGVVNPHGVVTGSIGQTYYDTVGMIHYICDGGTNWSVI